MLLALNAWGISYVFRPGNGLQLSWKADDKVGVTTGNVVYDSMEQLAFWMSSKELSAAEKELYAVGYQLKTGTTYYSYYPYTWCEAFDARNIRCAYDQQLQTYNGSTASLAEYDYQMAKAVPSADGCTFSYRHIGGVLRFTFPSPNAINLAELKLRADDPVFPAEVLMDIVGQKVKHQQLSTSIKLKTKKILVMEGEQVVLYLTCPAIDLSGTELYITVTDDNGNTYDIAKIMGPNVKAGYLYDVSLTEKPSVAAAKRLLPDVTSQIQSASSGVANPIAAASDIKFDTDYTVQYVVPKVEEEVTAIRFEELSHMLSPYTGNADIHTIDGKKLEDARQMRKGNIYICQGKKYIK